MLPPRRTALTANASLSRLGCALPALRRWAALALVCLLCAPALLFSLDLCFGIGQRLPIELWRSGLGPRQWGLILFAPLALLAWGCFLWQALRWARRRPRSTTALAVCALAGVGSIACLGFQAFLAVFATAPAWMLIARAARPDR